MSTCTLSRPKTANDHARDFFKKAMQRRQRVVTNVDLHEYVANKTGQTKAVLNGTLDGTGPGTLVDSDWYVKNWHKEKAANRRVVHRRHTAGEDPLGIAQQREMSFDTAAKQQACRIVMEYLPTCGKPFLLTLASAQGNCVQAAVARNPRVLIDNIEKDSNILKVWQATKARLGVETSDYCCLFQEFVSAPKFGQRHYDVINADMMGYPSQRMHATLTVLNRLANSDVIALTLQHNSEFRNVGVFQDALRAKYAHSKDKQAACVSDWLSNYRLVRRHTYRKGDTNRYMDVLIFQRKGL